MFRFIYRYRCSKGISYLLWHFEKFLYTFTEISDGNVKIYVRPLLEYNAIIWSPTSLKYIEKCERIQRYFTKRLRGF